MSNNAKLTTRDYLLSTKHQFVTFGATVHTLTDRSQSIAGIIFRMCRQLNIPLLY
jgi:hypothetical protein